jgi:hypothetical protein
MLNFYPYTGLLKTLILLFSTSQMRKPKPAEVKCLVQALTAGRGWRWTCTISVPPKHVNRLPNLVKLRVVSLRGIVLT